MVDIGQALVKSTYNLEGDGLLAAVCYTQLLELEQRLMSPDYRNLYAAAVQASNGNEDTRLRLIEHGI